MFSGQWSHDQHNQELEAASCTNKVVPQIHYTSKLSSFDWYVTHAVWPGWKTPAHTNIGKHPDWQTTNSHTHKNTCCHNSRHRFVATLCFKRERDEFCNCGNVCEHVCVLTLVLAEQGRGDPGFGLDHPARGHVLVLHGWWRDHHLNAYLLFNPAGKYDE